MKVLKKKEPKSNSLNLKVQPNPSWPGCEKRCSYLYIAKNDFFFFPTILGQGAPPFRTNKKFLEKNATSVVARVSRDGPGPVRKEVFYVSRDGPGRVGSRGF